MARPHQLQRGRERASGGLLLIVGMAAVAANLRPAASTVGPVLDEIRDALGLSAIEAGVLTALPPLCFGLLALASPFLAARLGYTRSIALAMAVLTAGLLFRVVDGVPALFVGTIAAGAGIAIGNVLMPVLVKRSFPHRAGLATGIYVGSMIGVASLAAALTIPLQRLLDGDWRVALVIWAIPAAIALVVWLPQVRHGSDQASRALDLRSAVGLLRAPVARQLMFFFGLQAAGFYAILAWLPTIFQSEGVSSTTAGALIGLSMVMGLPAALLIPAMAARARDQRWYVAGGCAASAIGLIGLIVAPASAPFLPYLWAIVIGLGQGTCFPLALTMIVLRSGGVGETAGLSTVVQGFGYIVAAIGPFTVGAIHGLTDSWSWAAAFILAMVCLQAVAGMGAGRNIIVGESLSGGAR